MINKISAFFWKIAGWKTFVAAVLIYLVFGAGVMPYGAKTIATMCGKPVEILDLQFSYSPAKARAILADYTPEARQYAANFNLIDDSLYPFAYTFIYIITIAWVFKTLLVSYRIGYYRHIHLLPITMMLVDYCENAGIITMLKTYPDFSDTVPTVTSICTSVKWSLVGVNTFVLLAGLVMLIYCRLNRKAVGAPQQQ